MPPRGRQSAFSLRLAKGGFASDSPVRSPARNVSVAGVICTSSHFRRTYPFRYQWSLSLTSVIGATNALLAAGRLTEQGMKPAATRDIIVTMRVIALQSR